MTEKLKLKECCEVITDGDHLPPPKATHGIPFITISNINANNEISFDDTMYVPIEYYDGLSETKKAKSEDVLLSVVGSFGKPVYIEKDEKFTFQRHIALLRHNNKVDGRFLYYTLLNPQFYKTLDKLAIGCSQRTVTLDTLRNIEIDVPRLDIQRKIVDCLSAIDEKIKINNSINNNLAKQIEAIYDYWFIQFNYPDANGKPYKASGGSMVYSDILKRNIPTSFSVHGLLELVNWESNSQPPKSEFVYEPKNGYVRFIQNRDYDSSDHVTYIPYKPNLSIVDKLDILIDKYGDAGATRYGIDGAFNVALGKINVNAENQLEYIRSFLSSKSIYDYLHNSCMASTRASLSEANLEPIKIPLPPVEVLDNFQTLVNGLRVSILRNIEENQKLTTLRNDLLPILMNGQATID